MADDKKPTDWRDKVKAPTNKNERMIGGENSLPHKDGKVDIEKMSEDKQNTDKKNQPRSKGLWEGRSGRGGGGVSNTFQEMLDRKEILPPQEPLSENKNPGNRAKKPYENRVSDESQKSIEQDQASKSSKGLGKLKSMISKGKTDAQNLVSKGGSKLKKQLNSNKQKTSKPKSPTKGR
jgi:hypothetical protein